MDTRNRVTTPVNSTQEIIRLRKAGKSRSEIVAALNKGGFKTALGGEWNVPNIGNQIARLSGEGRVKLRTDYEKAKKNPVKTTKVPKTVALKSKGNPGVQHVSVLLRIPINVEDILGKVELHVMSFNNKAIPLDK